MKKILIIEDESALQKTLGEALSQQGYEVLSALNGEVGLKLVQSEKPDLILLDLILPKIHGFDVLKKIKDNPETKEIPVIVLTNLETIEDIKKAIELGATTYLVKADYSLKELTIKINQVFQSN